ncbi:MAG: hypothetical protein MUF29_09130 [Chitinophagaceae bacterium]|jgi:hypothetical protein|nr:hypothetical protein [Chitinophagaceae bacterium]
MKNALNSLVALFSLALFSCTAAKVGVPAQFASQADHMKVKGVNGFTINQSLNFGPYITGEMKRGWDFSGKWQASNISFRPEDQIYKFFNIGLDNKTVRERNKFQFAIRDGKLMADVFAFEESVEKGRVIKTATLLGEVEQRNSLDYSFSAAIVPYNFATKQPWKLVISSSYDRRKDTARGLMDLPYAEEAGYATDGQETISIKPLRIDKVTTKSGKNTNVLGPAMLSGYELRIEDGVIAVVDILEPSIWIYRELDQPTRMIVAAIGSSILLKRKQDVNNE